jgi:tight adherence protein B
MTLPTIFIALGCLMVLVLLAITFAGPSAGKAGTRRMTALKLRHSDSAGAVMEAQMRKAVAARKPLNYSSGTQMSRGDRLRLRLNQTGKTWTVKQYMSATIGIAIVVGSLITLKGAPIYLGLAGGALIGAAIPHMVVNFLIGKRIKAFTSNFPDAIELLVRGLKAGMPIGETLSVVAKEIPGPVGEEFKLVTEKIKIGKMMEDALQDTADRLGTPEIQFFVITLAIQRETGGNLAETLGNLADVLRKRAAMKLKIRSMSSEAKASAYILGALPFCIFGMIYTVNPEYIGGFFYEPRLMIAGIIGMVWMSIGVFIMAKMINFEI